MVRGGVAILIRRENILDKREKKYIRKALFGKLKYLRYMVCIMIMVCLLFVGIPIFFKHLINGDIWSAITSMLGIIYPTIFFGGVYLFIEYITGNQIFKFINGNYTVSREILYAKYRETSKVRDSFMPVNMHRTRNTYINYCDTNNHIKVQFIDDESYRNAEIGCIAIVIQFGKNRYNTVAFVLQDK